MHKTIYSEIQPHTKTQNEAPSTDTTSGQNDAITVSDQILSQRCMGTLLLCIKILNATSIHDIILRIPTDTPPLELLTVELLFRHLLPHSSKWQPLGEALSLDEDILDEIFTKNEREEDCLQEMLEHYMMRSDLDHSWEEIEAALIKIETSSELHCMIFVPRPHTHQIH